MRSLTACMWPRRIPDWVGCDPRRSAEIAVYESLARALDESWSVYYSRPWWGINQKGGEIDGEADFIVAHPDFGVLFIEVKGGRIAYSPDTERWQTKDRNAVTHNIKDPVLQAKTCKHQFIKKLGAIQGWPKGYIRFRHGVIFPDSMAPSSGNTFLGGYERELFCFADRFDTDLRGWVEERLRPHDVPGGAQDIGPGAEGIGILNELIARPVQLRVPMVREVQGDLADMESLLTGAQLALMGIILSQPRIIVEGGAGTGKTLLATEIAVREAQLGRLVLFCCRSEPLAKTIAAKLKAFPEITVATVEGDGNSLITMMSASDTPRWNSVIIDEAQDFDWEWWDLVERIAKQNAASIRIFGDSNQAVYRLRADLETRLSAQSVSLNINLRNTQSIARVTDALYTGPLILPCGPVGEKPARSECSIGHALQQAISLIDNLLQEEGLLPNMVALLVPNANLREEALSVLGRKRISATDAVRSEGRGVIVETVPRFKGLEACVVILVADRQLAKNQEQAYVGVSRARSRLFVVGATENTSLGDALTHAVSIVA